MATLALSNNKRRDVNADKDVALSDKDNWKIHMLFVRKEFDVCLAEIEKLLQVYSDNEFALYTKGVFQQLSLISALIKRYHGEIQGSLELFEKCYSINPSLTNIKQIARSLYFLLLLNSFMFFFTLVSSLGSTKRQLLCLIVFLLIKKTGFFIFLLQLLSYFNRKLHTTKDYVIPISKIMERQ